MLRPAVAGRYDSHELIRQYAEEQLHEAGELEETQDRHLEYYLTFAEAVEQKLLGVEQQQWLTNLETDHDNLRAALAWSRVTSQGVDAGLRLVGTLFWLWQFRNHWHEGRAWAEAALARADTSGSPFARARALYCAGALGIFQGEYVTAHAQIKESEALFRQEQDTYGIAFALTTSG